MHVSRPMTRFKCDDVARVQCRGAFAGQSNVIRIPAQITTVTLSEYRPGILTCKTIGVNPDLCAQSVL